ncbi:cell division protein ZapA [Candidatus Thiosymbion oneisti]|uniref:cell division protein ZapA n=1 Tax=Candidatus Thiosymbion oneisti TaxID=589554 RepID=UPI000B001123|nr:cell division protein ZapA [Candidatus Thiosymbion oneisti]
MSEEPIAVSVRILDKEYRVSCAPDEEAGLREAARLLDERMRKIRQTGRILGADRIAVMAALNIAYELAKIQSSKTPSEQELDRRLGDLQKRLGDTLTTQHQDALATQHQDALATQHQMDARDETV